MELVERFWKVITTVMSVITFSPLESPNGNQAPLLEVLPSTLTDSNYIELMTGPIFQPPGTPDGSNFVCNYSYMSDWEACSTPTDRGCWLQRKDDPRERFDIYTDYENAIPIGVTRYYTLNLTDSYWDADGLNFTEAKLFNNEYPGPWIQACWGDTIVVNVTNSLRWNGTSVHWHGIRQNQTNQMDGVNGVSQCPIAPRDHFVYSFQATQYGSSWYHSHYSVQYADGAAGGLTIHGPTSAPYDDAVSPPLIMTDWGHGSAFEAVIVFLPGKGGLVDPDILLNGRGNITKFNSSIEATTPIQPPFQAVFDSPVSGQPVKKYLMRIINTSFMSTFIFTIDNHQFEVVEADFVPVKPYMATSILVGIGQRYDIVVDAWPLEYEGEPFPGDMNFWIRTYVPKECYADMEPPRGDPGYEEVGIIRYNSDSTAYPTTSPWPHLHVHHCEDETYRNLHPLVPWFVGRPSNTLEHSGPFDINFSDPRYPLAVWYLGKSPATPLRVNYSNPTFFHFDHDGAWPPEWRIESEDFNALDGNTHWVYLVIESPVKAGKAGTGSHPIHLHGHDFALLDLGKGPYHKSTGKLKLINPPRRDVVLLPAGGYIVIAFKADNPGAWLVHCHIAFHISGGLGMQILEDRQNANDMWPLHEDNDAQLEAHRVCERWIEWNSQPKKHHFPQPDCLYSEDECFQNDSGV